MTQKYTLKFVNDGKPFTMPPWSTEKHEAAIAHCLAECGDLPADKQDRELRFYVIYETLHELDDSVEVALIKSLHPEDLIELFNAVYNAGRSGILFQEKSTRKKSK